MRHVDRLFALALVASLWLPIGLAMGSADAAGLVGKPCSKVGSTTGDGSGGTLICTKVKKGKNKGRLVWQPLKGPAPSPTPTIPQTIESWGVELSPSDPGRQRAGDLYVGSIPFPPDFIIKSPVEFFGGPPKRPQDPPDYLDPQMTFIVPKDTVVRAMTSGTVCDVRYLNTGYSDDYTIGIGVAAGGKPACSSTPDGRGFGTIATWEHEHLMEPMVKPGDTVQAGQPIGVASYYREDYWLFREGYALYEIGVLTQTPDGRPVHTCPALYLRPAIKERMLAELAAAARAFESAAGTQHYADSTLVTGCVTDKPSYA